MSHSLSTRPEGSTAGEIKYVLPSEFNVRDSIIPSPLSIKNAGLSSPPKAQTQPRYQRPGARACGRRPEPLAANHNQSHWQWN
jgi:hypothetical protein